MSSSKSKGSVAAPFRINGVAVLDFHCQREATVCNFSALALDAFFDVASGHYVDARPINSERQSLAFSFAGM